MLIVQSSEAEETTDFPSYQAREKAFSLHTCPLAANSGEICLTKGRPELCFPNGAFIWHFVPFVHIPLIIRTDPRKQIRRDKESWQL